VDERRRPAASANAAIALAFAAGELQWFRKGPCIPKS
jgi:hypothetical protein